MEVQKEEKPQPHYKSNSFIRPVSSHFLYFEPRIAGTGKGAEKDLSDNVAQNPEMLTLYAVRINLRSFVFFKDFIPFSN